MLHPPVSEAVHTHGTEATKLAHEQNGHVSSGFKSWYQVASGAAGVGCGAGGDTPPTELVP